MKKNMIKKITALLLISILIASNVVPVWATDTENNTIGVGYEEVSDTADAYEIEEVIPDSTDYSIDAIEDEELLTGNTPPPYTDEEFYEMTSGYVYLNESEDRIMYFGKYRVDKPYRWSAGPSTIEGTEIDLSRCTYDEENGIIHDHDDRFGYKVENGKVTQILINGIAEYRAYPYLPSSYLLTRMADEYKNKDYFHTDSLTKTQNGFDYQMDSTIISFDLDEYKVIDTGTHILMFKVAREGEPGVAFCPSEFIFDGSAKIRRIYLDVFNYHQEDRRELFATDSDGIIHLTYEEMLDRIEMDDYVFVDSQIWEDPWIVSLNRKHPGLIHFSFGPYFPGSFGEPLCDTNAFYDISEGIIRSDTGWCFEYNGSMVTNAYNEKYPDLIFESRYVLSPDDLNSWLPDSYEGKWCDKDCTLKITTNSMILSSADDYLEYDLDETLIIYNNPVGIYICDFSTWDIICCYLYPHTVICRNSNQPTAWEVHSVDTPDPPSPEPPEIIEQPASPFLAVGDRAKLSVTASGEGLTYQWQYLTPNAVKWKNCTASSATSSTLSFTASAAYHNRKFRCIVTDSMGNEVSTEPAVITIVEALAITKQPESAEILTGKKAYFSVEASGEGLTYQWQYQKAGKKTWTNSTASGNQTDTLAITAAASKDGMKYRCVVTDIREKTAASDAAVLTVIPKPEIITQPEPVEASLGVQVKLSVEASGTDLTYQWQYQKPGTTTWKMPGTASGTLPTLSFRMTSSYDGRLFRCKVTGKAGGYVYSDAVPVTLVDGPPITGQPEDLTAVIGTQATFHVEAVGDDLSYQWEYQKAGETAWLKSAAVGNDSATIRMLVTKNKDGRKFRCTVTDSKGNFTVSKYATLTAVEEE